MEFSNARNATNVSRHVVSLRWKTTNAQLRRQVITVVCQTVRGERPRRERQHAASIRYTAGVRKRLAVKMRFPFPRFPEISGIYEERRVFIGTISELLSDVYPELNVNLWPCSLSFALVYLPFQFLLSWGRNARFALIEFSSFG